MAEMGGMRAPEPVPDEGLTTLVTRLVAEAKDYGRAEMAYVQALASDRAHDATRGVGLMAGAGVVAMAVLTTLLVGLVMALTPLIGALWATVIIVGGGGLAAAVLARAGLAKLRNAARKPEPETTP